MNPAAQRAVRRAQPSSLCVGQAAGGLNLMLCARAKSQPGLRVMLGTDSMQGCSVFHACSTAGESPSGLTA